jgi:gliding motility-associated-like protein
MKKICLLMLFCLLCQAGFSQNFTASLMPPVNTTGWTYATGVSSIVGAAFQLTDNIPGPTGAKVGYLYYSTPVNLTNCAQFKVDFQFQIIGQPGYNMTADGMTFFYVVNPPTAFGALGQNLGLPLNSDGLALVLDTYDNDGNMNNPSATLLGWNGSIYQYEEPETPDSGVLGEILNNQDFITDGSWHSCRITYLEGNINVYFNNDTTTPAISGYYPLSNLAGYFGFSASTGGVTSIQKLRDITITGYSVPPPPATPADSISYCQGTPADTLVATGSNLQWYTVDPSSGIIDTFSGSPTPNTSVVGTYYYYVAQQPAVCISTLDTIKVVVGALLPPPVITGDTVYCVGEPFVPFNIAGQNALWYPTDTSTMGSAVAPTVNTNAPGMYTYYATQQTSGCVGPKDSITVSVKPTPSAPVVTTPVIYCQDDSAISLAGNAVGDSLLWYTNPPAGGSATAPTPVTATADTTAYYVSQTIGGCESNDTLISVIVKQKPELKFNISDTLLCRLGSITITYTGNVSGSAQYNWTLPADATLVSGTGAGPLVVSFDAAGISPIMFSVIDNGCQSNDTTINIDVIQPPAPEINYAKDVCIGLPDVISFNDVSGNNNDVYSWNFNGASDSSGSGAGPYNVTWNTVGTYVISLSVATDGCPSNTALDTITVQPLPDVHIAPLSSNNICIGDSLQLDASTTMVPAYAYQWSPTADFQTSNGATVYGVIDTPGYISVQAISNYGCVNTDSVFVTTHPCCDVYLPNAFTPNGDGRNDVFRIIGARPQKIVDFRIVDRWGKVIYNATDDRGWDGTSNGSLQDIGTYYYYISYVCNDGKEYQKKGDVILIR